MMVGKSHVESQVFPFMFPMLHLILQALSCFNFFSLSSDSVTKVSIAQKYVSDKGIDQGEGKFKFPFFPAPIASIPHPKTDVSFRNGEARSMALPSACQIPLQEQPSCCNLNATIWAGEEEETVGRCDRKQVCWFLG